MSTATRRDTWKTLAERVSFWARVLDRPLSLHRQNGRYTVRLAKGSGWVTLSPSGTRREAEYWFDGYIAAATGSTVRR